MFLPETKAEVPIWNERKLAQWARMRSTNLLEATRLHLIRSGEAQTQFMVRYDPEGFCEAILIGQLPQMHEISKLKNRRPEKPEDVRQATDDEKPGFKRRIDLTDDQIDAVLARWARNESVLKPPQLAFIKSVWRADGKEYA